MTRPHSHRTDGADVFHRQDVTGGARIIPLAIGLLFVLGALDLGGGPGLPAASTVRIIGPRTIQLTSKISRRCPGAAAGDLARTDSRV